MNKTVCSITPIHGREEITVRTIERLKRQSCTVIPILVGDSSNKETAERIEGSVFVEMPNRPIHRKVAMGVRVAREFEPDAVMHLGSDDWISDNWLDFAFKCFDKGYLHLAGRHYWVLNIVDEFALYGTNGLYCDSGEVIHSSLYEKFNWELQENNDQMMGKGRKRMFESIGVKRQWMNTDMLCIHGSWQSYHTMEIFKGMYGAEEVDGQDFLDDKFPDVFDLGGME